MLHRVYQQGTARTQQAPLLFLRCWKGMLPIPHGTRSTHWNVSATEFGLAQALQGSRQPPKR